MIYKFKDAAHFRSGFDREAAAQHLGSILERTGYLSEEAIIEDGLRPESPLHPQFDYTAAEALAELHQREARYLQRSFVTIIVTEDHQEREVRAVVPVITREHPDERRYISTIVALSDDEYRQQVLDRALGDLLALRRKYADLEELARIFKAIDATAKKLRAA